MVAILFARLFPHNVLLIMVEGYILVTYQTMGLKSGSLRASQQIYSNGIDCSFILEGILQVWYAPKKQSICVHARHHSLQGDKK